MRGLILAAVLVSSLQCCTCDCPQGWRANQTSCYLYFHEKYTWFEAKVACDVAQASLVEINNEEENLFIKDLATEQSGATLWTGMEDFIVEGEYQWSGSHTEPQYFNWAPDDPNNFDNNEDCVSFHAESGFWFDIDCEWKSAFVCEAPADEGVVG